MLAGLLFAGFALTVLPMAAWAAFPSHHYFRPHPARHHHRHGRLGGSALTAFAVAFPCRAVSRCVGAADVPPQVDNVDATGVTAVVPPTMVPALLAGWGVALARRSALALLGSTVLLLAPLASVFTVDGLARRTFVMAPFVAVFAAIGVSNGTTGAQAWPGPRWVGPALGPCSSPAMAWENIYGYFGQFAGSAAERGCSWTITCRRDLHPQPSVRRLRLLLFGALVVQLRTSPLPRSGANGTDRSAPFGDVSIATYSVTAARCLFFWELSFLAAGVAPTFPRRDDGTWAG